MDIKRESDKNIFGFCRDDERLLFEKTVIRKCRWRQRLLTAWKCECIAKSRNSVSISVARGGSCEKRGWLMSHGFHVVYKYIPVVFSRKRGTDAPMRKIRFRRCPREKFAEVGALREETRFLTRFARTHEGGRNVVSRHPPNKTTHANTNFGTSHAYVVGDSDSFVQREIRINCFRWILPLYIFLRPRLSR